MDIGAKIRELRLESNLTQEMVARSVRVNPSKIKFYESDRGIPDAYTLSKLANFFGVTSDYLLGLSIDREGQNRIESMKAPMRDELVAVADYYGDEEQMIKSCEELSELIQAMIKHRTKKSEKSRKNLIGEMADTELMMTQVKYLLNIDQKEVTAVKEQKIKRQIKRIQSDIEIEKEEELEGQIRIE
jgi:Helix-turn-helix.